MGKATAKAKKRFSAVTVLPVLVNGVLDILASQRILEFGSEDGQSVQKQHHVDAALVLFAVLQLANDRELVGRVEFLAVSFKSVAG